MKDYSDYIEECLKDYPNDAVTFKYKKSVFDEMVRRTKEIKARGLANEDVLYDLVVDENRSDSILGGYKKYISDLRFKNRAKQLPKISLFYILGLVVAYLLLGFVFDLWHPGWLVIEVGVSALLIGLMMFFVPRLNKTKWYFVSRLFIAGSVMIASQAIFLIFRIPLQFMQSYLIVVAAPAVMLLGDLILATVTKQRMLILNYLLCIPAIMSLVYAILGITRVIAWDPGWLLMILAVLIDFAIVFGVIRYNKKYSYKPEEDVQ